MRPIDTAVAVVDLAGGSDLYRDYVLKRDTPVHAALGSFHAASADWKRVAGVPARVDAKLAEHLVAYNRVRGVSPETIARLQGLADGSVRAVVTGQQPGVAGGPLMTLHKIVTARALARAMEAREGIRCVPVFWLGADDDDFAEIRELATLSADTALVSVSLPADATAPGRRVGDIAAGVVRDAWRTMSPLLPADHDIAGAVSGWMSDAADLGDAAARCIVALCGGEVAVIDGREPLLRECTRDILLGFFDREPEVRGAVAAAGAALTRGGYHAQLDLGSSSGLFLVDDAVRRRVPPEQRAAVRERFAADIRVVSPGVVARNLMQDAALRPLAVVLGPAEIAYRAQLDGVYDALGVTRPVVFPRMTATFVPPPVAELLRATGLDAAMLVRDPAGIADAARARLKDAGFGAAAVAARESFEELVRRFSDTAAQRLDLRARDKLEKRLADISHRLGQALQGAVEQDTASAAARFPFLAGMAELFVRAGAPQERYLSMSAPCAYHGGAAWPGVGRVADDFCTAALDGGVAHRVYSL